MQGLEPGTLPVTQGQWALFALLHKKRYTRPDMQAVSSLSEKPRACVGTFTLANMLESDFQGCL